MRPLQLSEIIAECYGLEGLYDDLAIFLVKCFERVVELPASGFSVIVSPIYPLTFYYCKTYSTKMGQKKEDLLTKRPYREVLIFIIPSVILLTVLAIGFVIEGSQQFSLLAQAFLHGKLNFLSPIGGAGQDPILWHGKIYWGEGLFPALLLVPFVGLFHLFHLFFYQGYIKWVLVFGVLFFVFRLARVLSYSKEDSLILAFGFTLGSVFIGIASVSSSWWFAQVLTTFLLFWSLYEFFVRKHRNWWVIGIVCALLLMTRVTAALIFIFFFLELWHEYSKKTEKIQKLIQLSLPLVVAICILGLYNFLRFHNPLNGGYADQLLPASAVISRSYGIFSLVHLPTNLYYAILGTPVPVLRNSNSWTLTFPYIRNNIFGMSIFITSPYLLYLFTNKWSSFDSRARHLLYAAVASALLVFSFYGLGLVQFGYRYSLDFLPELFLLFMILYHRRHSQLSFGMKTLLLGSGIINFYLLWAFIL